MIRGQDKYVRRYTTLSSALDTLAQRHLVLLSPSKWDDQNDVYFMELYKEHHNLGSVLALCCTLATETYHHWRVFTQGLEGVCIEFEREALEFSFASNPEITTRKVEYLKVSDLEAFSVEGAANLPYVKRDGFSDEREWRIVLTCSQKAEMAVPVSIDLSSIKRVILNPWMPPPLADNLRKLIHDIPGCRSLKIVASRLTNSARWKAAGKKIAGM
jgi:Protein of unknown function (DUF2971)